ncbi:MAG: TldD/PmbA family protein [Sphingomonadaceae bacterium]
MVDRALAAARQAGADAADALVIVSASTTAGVRLGELEEASRSESRDLGLRVLVGARSAQVATSDLSEAAIAEAAGRAVAMARLAPEDPYAGLAETGQLAHGPFPCLDLFDEAVLAITPQQLRAMAQAAEAAALGVAGVSNSEGGSATAGHSRMALGTSTGFRGTQEGTSVSVSAVAIAGEGAARQRDYDWSQARFLSDLRDPEGIGRSAGERASARRNPVRLATGAMPVVFDWRVSASLLGHLAGAMSGPAIARGTSFLKGRQGERLFRPGVRVVDDPHRRRGLRSRAFDGEGLPTARTLLVDDGMLGGWLLDSASARQLGLRATGHASRGLGGPPTVATSNLHLEAGTMSVESLIADIRLGFLVTELIGMGVNGLTGDYSRGAAGFAIRDGAIAEPVTEMTIAGNLLDMFRELVPADDLVFRLATNSPTVRVDGMTVAGA